MVIGLHTPEFHFEHEIDNVRWAVQDLRVGHPVAIDGHNHASTACHRRRGCACSEANSSKAIGPPLGVSNPL